MVRKYRPEERTELKRAARFQTSMTNAIVVLLTVTKEEKKQGRVQESFVMMLIFI